MTDPEIKERLRALVAESVEARKAALADIYLRAWQRYEPAVAKVTPPPSTPEAAAAHQSPRPSATRLM